MVLAYNVGTRGLTEVRYNLKWPPVFSERGYWKFKKGKVKWKFKKGKVKWESDSLFSREKWSDSLFFEGKVKWFTLFEGKVKWKFKKGKVKWESDSLFSRSEKWNESVFRSRSRCKVSREFSWSSCLKNFEKGVIVILWKGVITLPFFPPLALEYIVMLHPSLRACCMQFVGLKQRYEYEKVKVQFRGCSHMIWVSGFLWLWN